MLDAGHAGRRGDAVAGSLLGMKISPGGGFSEGREGRGVRLGGVSIGPLQVGPGFGGRWCSWGRRSTSGSDWGQRLQVPDMCADVWAMAGSV